MTIQFDEKQWPDLTNFRTACLEEQHDEMRRIADLAHHWYANENPEDIPMEKLAKIFQAQHYAASNDLEALEDVVTTNPWTVNHPWTAQGWLPIAQAASLHGDKKMVEFLLDHGADPALRVGDPGERASVPEMARYGGHDDLAVWLEELVNERGA